MTLAGILRRHDRLLIAGLPSTGKTTLADQVTDRPVIHTDDYIAASWDNAPRYVTQDVVDHPRWVIEGVRALATLRHGADAQAVIWLWEPIVPLTETQQRWADNRATSYQKAKHSLLRGLEVYEFRDARALKTSTSASATPRVRWIG